jgi:hypothetical protein
VLLLTPDTEAKRLGSEIVKKVANENVIFEAGAAYGRYGLKRVILLKDPTVEMISDLQGVISIPVDVSSPTLNTDVFAVASDIDAHIGRVFETEQESRLRWLSLMKCRPALQQRVINWLQKVETEAKRKWDVRYERHGVLWGPPDDFLLFSVPGVEQFIGFITYLRARLGDNLVQVDSRLVFPNKYWHNPIVPVEMKSLQLVLLACAPQHVESAYDALVDAAKNDALRATTEVEIVTVGVATGDADLFFITAAQREELHRRFVETHLHDSILQEGWLTHNTTSMVIT